MRKIISHRGFPVGGQKAGDNSLADLERALRLGMDVETDVRFVGPRIVVSHDNPMATDGLPTLDDFFALLKRYSDRTAWVNVKCDGMGPSIYAVAQVHDVVGQIVAFDFALPDLIGCRRKVPALPVAYRYSQYETIKPYMEEQAESIWFDLFHPEDLISADYMRGVARMLSTLRRDGRVVETPRIAVVSPEVHLPSRVTDFNYPGFAWDLDRKGWSVLTDRPDFYDERIK